MKIRIFLCLILLPMTGCELTAQFYVEKAWNVSPGFSPEHPDMKTRIQVEMKKKVGLDAIKVRSVTKS